MQNDLSHAVQYSQSEGWDAVAHSAVSHGLYSTVDGRFTCTFANSHLLPKLYFMQNDLSHAVQYSQSEGWDAVAHSAVSHGLYSTVISRRRKLG